MQKAKTRIFFSILFFCLVWCQTAPQDVCAKNKESWPEGVELSYKKEAACVMELDSMAILYGKHMKKAHFPASITKVMTALVAIENGNLDDTVRFSHEAVYSIDRGSAHIARDEGEKMSLKNCLYGLMLESANECAYAIAEHVGDGDYDRFIKLMNHKAKELGCVNTHFCNPHGLHDDKHYTCAYDMALIARAAYQNKTFRKIVGTATYTIPPTNKHEQETFLNNHHAMLHVYRTSRYLYEYCVGGKTGYTSQANNTLVTFAKKGGQTLVCVIMNAGQYMHYNDTRILMDYCFSQFHTVPIHLNRVPGFEELGESIKDIPQNVSDITFDEGYTATLPVGIKLKNTSWRAVTTAQDIYPAESEGKEPSGAIEYTYADHRVGSIPFHYVTEADESASETSAAPETVKISHGALTIIGRIFIVVLVVSFLLFLRYMYVAAPYYHYYGSSRIKEHFAKQRQKRMMRFKQHRREHSENEG